MKIIDGMKYFHVKTPKTARALRYKWLAQALFFSLPYKTPFPVGEGGR